MRKFSIDRKNQFHCDVNVLNKGEPLVNIIRGVLCIVIGILLCVGQGTGIMHDRGTGGYLYGGLLIAFGIYRLYRGITAQK